MPRSLLARLRPGPPAAREEPEVPLGAEAGGPLTAAHVADVYEQLLGRTPTPDEVDHQLANAPGLAALLDAVLASDERRERRPDEPQPSRSRPVVNVYTEELREWGHEPGTWSEDGVAVMGHAGWLFLGGGTNAILDQHRGEVERPEGWAEQWRAAVEVRRREAAELGAQLVTVVVPDKLPVLAERFPEPLPPPGAVRPPAAHLVENLGLLWPVAALRDVRGGAYLRTDTHLSYAGNATLARLIGTELGVPLEHELTAQRTRRYVTSGDLGSRFTPEVVEVVVAPSDFGDAEVVETNREELAALGGHIGTRQVLRNERAADPRTAVVFGDSYAFAAPHYQGIAWFLAQTFRCVHFVWSPFGWDRGYVERCGASVVVCEGAERFAIRPPDVRVDALALAEQTLERLRAGARGEAPEPEPAPAPQPK